jgi:putative endonuclease
MVLLDRNWRCSLGEIDLVLRDGNVVVFCEVKTRTSHSHGHPVEAVDEVKVQRMAVLAEAWCNAQGLRPPERRLDVVGVLVEQGRIVAIDHVRGVGG